MRTVFRAAAITTILLALGPPPALAQVEPYLGKPIAAVRVNVQGQPSSDATLTEVIETRAGEPLAAARVRESIVHLMALGRFDDVQVDGELASGGVVLTYALRPVRAVQDIDFAGRLGGIDAGQLRSTVVDHYGASPPLSRTEDIRQALLDQYRDHGYSGTKIAPRPDLQSRPGRVTLTFDIEAGRQARIERVNSVEIDRRLDPAELQRRLGLKPGSAYDPNEVTQRISDYTDSLRSKGYYEANIAAPPRFSADNATVQIDLTAVRGPRVTVALAGDPVPSATLDDLIPIKRENSVDKDLIEDWAGNIERHLRTQGYQDAKVAAEDRAKGDERQIVFNVRRGPRYLIESIDVQGNRSIPTNDLLAVLGTSKVGRLQPFAEPAVRAGVDAIRVRYRRDGFTTPAVTPEYARQTTPDEVRVSVTIQIAEGTRTTISSIAFDGNERLSTAELNGAVKTSRGSGFYPPALDDDRSSVLLEYLNRGYLLATVTLPDEKAMVSADRTRADVRFVIHEGPQIVLDQVLIVGNDHTKTATIRKALRMLPGQPLGLASLSDAQQRVAALGMFRRVQVTPLGHGSETKRDLLVTVQEAPATSLAYGGGIEGAKRQRLDASGNATEAIEIAPRVVFEIGRRNLWGTNRSINFNGSLAIGAQATGIVDKDLWVYRALGTYREPHIFGAAANLVVTGGVEQAVRPAYSFNRRGVRAELSRSWSRSLSKTFTVYARYGLDRTHVVSEPTDPDDLIAFQRAFPNVLLSKLSSSVVRDTRDDSFDPSRGTLTSVDGEVAPLFLGSEVGVAKTLLQGFVYKQLPTRRRIVFAGGVRLGFGTGWGTTTVVQDGKPVVVPVEGPPISERFFAGGNTTVRGVAEDTLGTPDTFDERGFATGGGSLILLNGELRYSLTKSIAAVTFVDAGNVYRLASTFDPTNLQPAVGLGFRYKSPIGPIRVDLGFNLNRRVLGTQRESLTVLSFGIGQAF